MATLYISSSYEDLKEERAAADAAARALGHATVAMERYTASGHQAVDKCLEDVRACDAYIGIFALRYGYFEPGRHGEKSITQLEFEEARRCGLPVFVFLLREDAPWYPNRIDKDRSRIDALRARLCREVSIRWFENRYQLAEEVTRTLSRELPPRTPHPAPAAPAAAAPREVPGLLPYLCDRSEQEFGLNDALQRATGAVGCRPIVCVIHGDESQCHDMFVERLRHHSIPNLLGLDPGSAPLPAYRLDWPSRLPGPSALGRYFHEALALRVLRRGSASRADVAGALAAHRGPVLIRTDLDTEGWGEAGPGLLRAMADFWADWPDRPVGAPLVVCLNFTYRTRHLGLFERGRYRKLNQQVRAFFGPPCREEGPGGVVLAALGELAAIRRQDALNWARGEEVAPFCTPGRLVREIEELFGRAEHRRAGGIAMERLATELVDLLRGHAPAAATAR